MWNESQFAIMWLWMPSCDPTLYLKIHTVCLNDNICTVPTRTETTALKVTTGVSNALSLTLSAPPPPNDATASSCPGSHQYRGFTMTLRHTTFGRTPLDEWSARRRDFYVTTQHSQERDIHVPGGIRTRNPSKRMVEGPRFRPRGHRDQLIS
jgi:hypothetical protein